MRILITNDDGIHARGLAIAEAIARAFTDDIFVIAPEFEQSGVSHSLSLNDPLRLREISPRHFALKGTPTDCVIMGLRKLMLDHPPDLLISGVNCGQNVAEAAMPMCALRKLSPPRFGAMAIGAIEKSLPKYPPPLPFPLAGIVPKFCCHDSLIGTEAGA
jgi:hypothetical protein